jgi:hypothetical protein
MYIVPFLLNSRGQGVSRPCDAHPTAVTRPRREIYSGTSPVGSSVRIHSRRPGPGIGRVIPIAVTLIAVLAANLVVFAAPVSSGGRPVEHLSTPAGPAVRSLFLGPGTAIPHGAIPAGSLPAAGLRIRGPTFEPNPAAVGHRFLIEANATGGQPPYQFRYSGLPVGCASQNLSEFSCRPNSTGNFSVEVNVTDSAGSSATSDARLRVNSDNTLWGEVWQQSGLGSRVQWGVTIYGTDYTSTAQQLQIFLSPGYYPYSVDAVPGYSGTPMGGSIVVNNSLFTIDVAFTRAVYPVTFLQSSLPDGTPWSVTVAGRTAASTNATAQLELPNGTASYSVAPPNFWRAIPPSGNLTVVGGPTMVHITFVPIPTFAVLFVASDLPSQSVWSVDLNGTILASTLSNLSTVESNGTYPFFVRPPAGWTASPEKGNVSVEGQAVRQPISFAFYRLTLHETGLPQGTNWSALVNGTLLFGTSANLTEGILAGTYGFDVNAPPGWTVAPQAGWIVVGPGTSGVANVSFVGPVEESNVTFLGSGLPSNLSWSVDVDGQNARAGFQGFVLLLPNGSYPFTVNAPSRWVASPSTGTVVVDGKPVNVSIVFDVPVPLSTSWLGADPQTWVTFGAALGGSVAAGLLSGVAVVRLRSRRG